MNLQDQKRSAAPGTGARGVPVWIFLRNETRMAGWLGIVTAILVCPAGCQSLPGEVLARKQIRETLNEQAKAWNAGDIKGFMDSYWHSPLLTFSSNGTVKRGWRQTMDNFKLRYPAGNMGHLKFDSLEIDELEKDLALVLGRFHLDQGAQEVGGAFTLVMRKQGLRWVIIHDHTSRDAPGDEH